MIPLYGAGQLGSSSNEQASSALSHLSADQTPTESSSPWTGEASSDVPRGKSTLHDTGAGGTTVQCLDCRAEASVSELLQSITTTCKAILKNRPPVNRTTSSSPAMNASCISSSIERSTSPTTSQVLDGDHHHNEVQVNREDTTTRGDVDEEIRLIEEEKQGETSQKLHAKYPHRTVRPQARAGCLACKKRRVKCDEGKPYCQRCVRRSQRCEYSPPSEIDEATGSGGAAAELNGKDNSTVHAFVDDSQPSTEDPPHVETADESPSNKQHECPYCSAEFTRLHDLAAHTRSHRQEQPYVCVTCQSRFRRLHDLKRHRKLHTGEQPHECLKCLRKFARGDALARHNNGPGFCAGRRASSGTYEDAESDGVYVSDHGRKHEPHDTTEQSPPLDSKSATQPHRALSANYAPSGLTSSDSLSQSPTIVAVKAEQTIGDNTSVEVTTSNVQQNVRALDLTQSSLVTLDVGLGRRLLDVVTSLLLWEDVYQPGTIRGLTERAPDIHEVSVHLLLDCALQINYLCRFIGCTGESSAMMGLVSQIEKAQRFTRKLNRSSQQHEEVSPRDVLKHIEHSVDLLMDLTTTIEDVMDERDRRTVVTRQDASASTGCVRHDSSRAVTVSRVLPLPYAYPHTQEHITSTTTHSLSAPLELLTKRMTRISSGSEPFDTTGQVPPPGMKLRLTATLWEDEGALCFQVEANGVTVARREDNNYINGTKLFNVAGMTRGRRDGILKSEKTRVVVKTGPPHLKGVWIPLHRALEFANKEKITDILYPLFVHNIASLLYNPEKTTRPDMAKYEAVGVSGQSASTLQPIRDQHKLSSDLAPTFPTPPTSAETVTGLGQYSAISAWNINSRPYNASAQWGQEYRSPPNSASSIAALSRTKPPQRVLTAYFLYVSHTRSKVSLELGPDARPEQVADEVARRWEVMGPAEKNIWNDLYSKNLAAYQIRRAAYMAGQPMPSEEDAARMVERGEASKVLEGYKVPSRSDNAQDEITPFRPERQMSDITNSAPSAVYNVQASFGGIHR